DCPSCTIGIYSSVHNASAAPAATLVRTDTNTGEDVQDAPVDPTDIIVCRASTNTDAGLFQVIITDPVQTLVKHVGVISSTGFIPDISFSPRDLDGENLNPGNWQVEYKFYKGDVLVQDLVADGSVSFFVLPESSFGAIGLVGSSIAVLSAFLVWKKRSVASTSTTERLISIGPRQRFTFANPQ